MKKVTSGADLVELSRDAGTVSLAPRAAYFAESEEDVVSAMRDASAEGLAVTARGAGTGIPTQSVGRGAILIQNRKAMELGDDRVACQPGVVKAELNRVLLPTGRWMPVDTSSYASCTIGGMVANNSSGVRTVKYGSTIDYVRALRMVRADGVVRSVSQLPIGQAMSGDETTRKAASLIIENQSDIQRERPKVTKNSSGYRLERVLHDEIIDLPKLFVGSEGTLGVVTEATLATLIRPRWKFLLVVESSLEELDKTTEAFRRHSPAALELVDKTVFRKVNRWGEISKYSRSESQYMIFCEFDGADEDRSSKEEEIAASDLAGLDPLVMQGLSEIQQAWEVRNETLAIAQEIRRGTKVLVPGVEDLVVPPARLGDLVRLLAEQLGKRGLEYIVYGHAGDANLHARPLLDPGDAKDMKMADDLMADCFEAVWRMGGSMSGEHGDGMLRAKYLEGQYPRTYWVMRELKELYDPKGILNPGVKIAWRLPP
ncbi:MAG: FAD-binding oxidoreductase [Thaumarchaeota archaeon]|nr:FAD-binding oxidoreductase [Nitrososphaerota archaeon]